MKHRVLAIIPARGGSKGIPRKNIVQLGGLPLIAHSILAAKACPLVDRVVVSTDHKEIAEVAREFGAEVPFMRPAELATDTALMGPVWQHCVQELATQGYHPSVAALLYPSHPFRPAGLLEECIMRNLEGHGPVVTAKQVSPGQFRTYGLYEGHLVDAPPQQGYLVELTDPMSCMDIDTPNDLRVAEEVLSRGLFPTPESAS